MRDIPDDLDAERRRIVRSDEEWARQEREERFRGDSYGWGKCAPGEKCEDCTRAFCTDEKKRDRVQAGKVEIA